MAFLLSSIPVTFEECEPETLYLQKGSWCSCAENTGEKSSLVLCLKCGSGFVFKNDKWVRVLSFDKEALNQILEVVK